MDGPGSSHGPGIAGSGAVGLVRLCLRSATRRSRRAPILDGVESVRAARTPFLSLAASATTGAARCGRRVRCRNDGSNNPRVLCARARVGSGSRSVGLLFGRSRGATAVAKATLATRTSQQRVAGCGFVHSGLHFAGVVAVSCFGGAGIFPLVVLDPGGLFRRARVAQLLVHRPLGIWRGRKRGAFGSGYASALGDVLRAADENLRGSAGCICGSGAGGDCGRGASTVGRVAHGGRDECAAAGAA